MKLVRKVRIKNALGLHARPATMIVKLLLNCKSEVTFTHKRAVINAKSILSILMLAATKNTQLTVTVDGDDADDIMDKLVTVFENGFGE